MRAIKTKTKGIPKVFAKQLKSFSHCCKYKRRSVFYRYLFKKEKGSHYR